MDKKKIKLLVFAGFFLLVAIVINAICSVISNKFEKGTYSTNSLNGDNTPIVEFELSSYEPNQTSVVIDVKAYMENDTKVTSIVLPDETLVNSNKASYTVYKNGEYTFKINYDDLQTESVICVDNLRENSSSVPYIPVGFTAVSDTNVENGFVIKDKYENEYVWIPVVKGQLTRSTLLDGKYEENNTSTAELVNSVAQNYGFYVARYEASLYDKNGIKGAASMYAKTPLSNVSCVEAMEYAEKSAEVFGYEDCKTMLINSYAWDTILEYLDNINSEYSSSINYGNYSDAIALTGATSKDCIYNIFDLSGNLSEWTSEIFKTSTSSTQNTDEESIYRVIRGGRANLSRTAQSRKAYTENTADPYWGFRMVLYK